MIESGLILTGNDPDLLRRALSEVKTKVYEESETRLDVPKHSMPSFRPSEMRRRKNSGTNGVTRILIP